MPDGKADNPYEEAESTDAEMRTDDEADTSMPEPEQDAIPAPPASSAPPAAVPPAPAAPPATAAPPAAAPDAASSSNRTAPSNDQVAVTENTSTVVEVPEGQAVALHVSAPVMTQMPNVQPTPIGLQVKTYMFATARAIYNLSGKV